MGKLVVEWDGLHQAWAVKYKWGLWNSRELGMFKTKEEAEAEKAFVMQQENIKNDEEA